MYRISVQEGGYAEMILFVGPEDRSFFLRETAKMKKMTISYVESSPSIELQLSDILEQSADYLVIDIEQYVTPADELAQKIESVKRAKNCDVIIYAPGYDRESRIITALARHEIRYYIFSANQADARQEFERCLKGYYVDLETPPETENMKEGKDLSGRRIGVTGVCRRIGSTTAAVQLVKYLQLKGYKACYVEVNGTGFVLDHAKNFICVHDEYLGRVTYEQVDMFYKQENLQEILKQDYDYYVFDYGAYSEKGFNKTSFLEKDVRIFVAGSKASEMKYTQDVLQNEYYTDVLYLFNFISEREKPDLLEFMEDKAESTYFTVYAPDQFEYVNNPELDRLLPVEEARSEPRRKRKGLFGRWRKEKAAI